MKATVWYAACGALFGACFPLGATLLDLLLRDMPLSFAAIIQVQAQQPLHWIIDVAPFVLGSVASLAGRREDRYRALMTELEGRVDDRTGELSELNDTLRVQISERHRVEQELRRAIAATETASRAKSDFLATMSHEIRTPLNGVIGMAGLLLDTPLNVEQREYASVVRSSGEALLAVINDILDVSKIEAGKLELEDIDFDIQALVEETVDLVTHAVQQRGIEFSFVVDPGVPSKLRGDPARLRQVLLNLLGNAAKFTSSGEIVLNVGVATESIDGTMLHVEVRDTGVGIPPDRIAGLFDSFSQVDASTTRQYGGTGLGLSISKRLCKLMQGDIGVRSTPGLGSTFWFDVLLTRSEGDYRRRTAGAAAGMAGREVVLIDANDSSRNAAALLLQTWGLDVAAGADVDSALAASGPSGRGAIAIADARLHDDEVAKLLEHLADVEMPALIRLVVPGARGESWPLPNDVRTAVVPKPVKPAQLLNALRAVTGLGTAGAQPASPPRDTGRAPAVACSAHILVAEDNVVNQKVTARILEKAGYSCDIADNGQAAVDALARTVYDLVLMDCQMPGLDGFDATAAIRGAADMRAASVPIIAMTANAMKGDREACLAAGMDDYISKPVRADTLLGVVSQWTAKRRNRARERRAS